MGSWFRVQKSAGLSTVSQRALRWSLPNSLRALRLDGVSPRVYGSNAASSLN